jgi:hypothetical protein
LRGYWNAIGMRILSAFRPGSTKTNQDDDDAEKNARNELHDRKHGGTNCGKQSRHVLGHRPSTATNNAHSTYTESLV